MLSHFYRYTNSDGAQVTVTKQNYMNVPSDAKTFRYDTSEDGLIHPVGILSPAYLIDTLPTEADVIEYKRSLNDAQPVHTRAQVQDEAPLTNVTIPTVNGGTFTFGGVNTRVNTGVVPYNQNAFLQLYDTAAQNQQNIVRVYNADDNLTSISKLEKPPKASTFDVFYHIMSDPRHFWLTHDGRLFLWMGTYWKAMYNDDIYNFVMQNYKAYVAADGRPYFANSVVEFIAKHETPKGMDLIEPTYIVSFIDGVYNLKTGTLHPHDRRFFIQHTLAVNFNCGTMYMPYFDKYLNDLSGGNAVVKLRLIQATGYLLSNNGTTKKLVVLYGKSNTGKSLYGDIIKLFYNNDNITTLNIEQLSERFVGPSLSRSALNINMDLSSSPLSAKAISMLKQLTGSDTVSGEQKGGNYFNYVCKARFLFATNDPVKVFSRDEAFAKRILLIHCTKEILPADQDHELLEKIKPEIAAIAKIAVMEFAKVIQKNYFFAGDEYFAINPDEMVVEPVIKTRIMNTFSDDDNIGRFVETFCHMAEGAFTPTNILHTTYCEFCQSTGVIPKSLIAFSTRLSELYPALPKAKKHHNKSKNAVNGFCNIELNQIN